LQVRWGATEAEAKQRAVEACRQVSNTCAGAGVTNRLDDVFVYYCCTEPRFGCATPPHATRERALQTVKKQMSSAGFSSCTVHAYYSARTGEKQKSSHPLMSRAIKPTPAIFWPWKTTQKRPWYQQKGTDPIGLVLLLAAVLVLTGLIVLVSI